MVKISKKFRMESIECISLMIGMMFCFVMGLITLLINKDIYFLLLWIICSAVVYLIIYLIKLFSYLYSIKRKATKS